MKKLILFLSLGVCMLGMSPAALAMDAKQITIQDQAYCAPVSNASETTKFHAACRTEDFDQIRECARRGVDINAKISNSMSALCFAAVKKKTELARLLIQLGADIETKDTEGVTVLGAAVAMRSFEVARLLIEHGANVNAHYNNGQTLLRAAAADGSVEFIRLLIEHGADVNIKDVYGNTPLHQFSSGFKRNESPQALKQCLEAFVSAGADINAKNNEGLASLIFALLRDNPAFFTLLLEHKAEPNRVDRRGNTALHYAVILQDKERVELLLKHGADKNIKNKKGYIAQDYDRNIFAQIKKAGQKQSQPKKQLKKTKKKTSKSTPTYAQRQERKSKLVAVPEVPESIAAAEEKPAAIDQLQFAPRVTRWSDQAFLSAKKLECSKDPRKGYWYFMRSKLYHQLPLDLLRLVVAHGDPEEWRSKKHPGIVRVRRVIEGQMIFADPAANPWNPGKSTQRGFYHCTPDLNGQIYHVGFDAIDEENSITLADFITDKSLKPDANNFIIEDDLYNIRHELFMPNQ